MRQFRFGILVAAAALAAGTAAAVQDGPIALLPGEKVTTILASTGETRIGGLALVAGSKVSISAKAKGTSKARPGLALRNPAGQVVDLGKAYRTTSKSAQVRSFPVAATGVHRLALSTPAGFGGTVELTAAAKVPAKQTRTGTTTLGTGSVSFDALPGSTLASLTVTCTAKPAWTPTVEVLDPSGASLGTVVGRRTSAVLRNLPLDAHGSHTVRVTGGDGGFKAVVALRSPKPRKGLQWADIVTPPGANSFTPLAADNDGPTHFDLSGPGFTTTDRVLFVQGTATKLVQTVTGATSTGAWFENDLAGLPAGDYRLEVLTKDNAKSVFPQTLEVRNRPPGVLATYPPFIPSGPDLPVVVTGAGFDQDAAFTVRRTSDQTPVPSSVSARFGSQRADLRLDPAAYLTGPCDIVISETSGVVRTFPGVVDLVGWRQPTVNFFSYSGADATSNYYPRDAAYDGATGLVCLAMREGTGVRFALFDPATASIADQVKINPPSATTLLNPRVAFDARDRVWALTWVAGRTSSYDARVRIVGASNLQTPVADVLLDTSSIVRSVDAAPDAERGGFLVTWDRIATSTGPGEIRARRVSSSGVPGGASHTVLATDSGGWTYDPAIVRASANRYVVAYAGINATRTAAAIWRVVADGDGTVLYQPNICASELGWYDVFQAEVAANPNDGSVMLAFTYDDGTTSAEYHPGTVPLSGPQLLPGSLVTVDDDGVVPDGFIDTLAWNPTRNEYVIAATRYDLPAVILRRIAPDGRIKVAPVSHQVEGIWGILWSGTAADTLGLVRLMDAAEDGSWTPAAPMYVRGGPMR